MHLLKRLISELSWAAFVLKRKTKSRLSFIKRMLIRPELPKNQNGKIYVHLGCGDIASPEFINVDASPASHIHYVCDVKDLSVFPDDYCDMVYACHVLEHIPYNDLRKVLWEWKRILKPHGVLRLSVPDFDKILDIYTCFSRDIMSILGPLLGGQEDKYNVHHSIFNSKYLSAKLREVGFRGIREWDPQHVSNHNFHDWADRQIILEGKAFPISLNLEAVK